jgi:hypothetical protein
MERFDHWYARYLGDRKAPEPGESVTFALLNNPTQRKGILVERTREAVTLRVGEATVTYVPTAFDEATRAALFPEAHARSLARRKVREEQEAARRAASAAARPASAAFANQGPNGLVPSVDQYIRANARFPDSIEYVQWYPVKKHEKGYYVRCRYRTGGGSFGQILADKVFIMDRHGRVVSTTTGLAKF